MKTKTLTLHCQLGCGREVGSVQLFIEAPQITEDEYRQKTGIVDQRCDECEVEHGTFKELTERFEKETNGTPAEAEAFIKQHRTREAINTALPIEKQKRAEKGDIIKQ